MSKSFKFNNNNYLDTSGIVHNKQPLNNIINDIFGRFLYYRGGFTGDNMYGTGIVDFDDLLTTGIWTYSGYNGIYKDNPITYYSYGIVVIFEGNNTYGVQLIFDMARSRIFFRTHTESKKYGSFKQIF